MLKAPLIATLLLSLLAGVPAAAQPAADPARPALLAVDLSGQPFVAQQLRGKVALVFYWSTACAVCRDSLPELRANHRGWQGKPFALLTVNVDRKAQDWRHYEHIAAQMQGAPQPEWFALRQAEGAAVPQRLPLTLVLDTQGRVVARYEGRMAPEAWDAIAELLL